MGNAPCGIYRQNKSLPAKQRAAHRCAGSVASSPQGFKIAVACLAQATAI